MSHLYYVTLGDKASYDRLGNLQPDFGLTNTGPFSNIQPYGNWSSGYTVYSGFAWYFRFSFGFQSYDGVSSNLSAWAVHDGDVGAAIPSAVPLPASVWLFGSGLLGFIGAKRRQSRHEEK